MSLRTGRQFTKELSAHLVNIEELLDDMEEQWGEGYETYLGKEFLMTTERMVNVKNRVVKMWGQNGRS